MYPSIITSSLELNIPYFKKLTEIICLDDEEYENSFDLNDPESFNDFLQVQFIHGLINSGVIEVRKTLFGTEFSAIGKLLLPKY